MNQIRPLIGKWQDACRRVRVIIKTQCVRKIRRAQPDVPSQLVLIDQSKLHTGVFETSAEPPNPVGGVPALNV